MVTAEQVASFNAFNVRIHMIGSTLGNFWLVPDGDDFKCLRSEFILEASEIPLLLKNMRVAEKLAEFKRKLPSRIVSGEAAPKQFTLEDLD